MGFIAGKIHAPAMKPARIPTSCEPFWTITRVSCLRPRTNSFLLCGYGIWFADQLRRSSCLLPTEHPTGGLLIGSPIASTPTISQQIPPTDSTLTVYRPHRRRRRNYSIDRMMLHRRQASGKVPGDERQSLQAHWSVTCSSTTFLCANKSCRSFYYPQSNGSLELCTNLRALHNKLLLSKSHNIDRTSWRSAGGKKRNGLGIDEDSR
jgi:hypothetical protein